MLLALILGPTLGAHGQIERLLVVQAALIAHSELVALAAVALALTLRRPTYASEESAAVEGGAVRTLWALPACCRRCR